MNTEREEEQQNAYNDFVGVYIDGEHAASLDAGTFPSLEPGETVRIKDILGKQAKGGA